MIKKLNLGCGFNKIPGYVNIDGERACKPDLVLDIVKKPLPFKKETISEVLFFHCIEHIRKEYHGKVLNEVYRVLKSGGNLIISYPNFWECAWRWKENIAGKRSFWEATLFGRQLYPGDYHVCAMDPGELTELLYQCGFYKISSRAEPDEVFNTITIATKGNKVPLSYEEAIARDMKNMVVRRS